MRRTPALSASMRSRKKFPYMVSYNKLPWNVVEAGSEDAHKLLAPSFIRAFETAATTRSAGLVRTEHPALPEDQWLFRLPTMSYILPLHQQQQHPHVLVAEAAATSEADDVDDGADGAAAATPLAPFGWDGKRVTDPMCLAHYGQLHAAVAPVLEVAEFRSPDLRLVCNAVRVGPLRRAPARMSALAAILMPAAQAQTQATGDVAGFCLYHFYRPNRAPTEVLAPFKRLTPNHKPDLSALAPGFEPKLARQAVGAGERATASPMPAGAVPTSPMYGLAEREAVRPGDTFGSRARMWGNHW